MGFWWRGQTEHLLFGVKGKIKAFRMQEKNIIEARVEKHSKKPDVFIELINRAADKSGLNNRLEMFARGQGGNGWHVYGKESKKSIII